MKRKTLFAVLCILCAMMLAACQCKHEWTEANCVNARTCSRCGEQEGQPLGHVLSPATCQTASRCSKCGGTVGTPADHSWQSATCTSPQICTVCSAVSGEALEHDWAEVVNQSGIPGRMCGVCMEMELRTDRWLPLTKLEKISASNEDGHYNDILTPARASCRIPSGSACPVRSPISGPITASMSWIKISVICPA